MYALSPSILLLLLPSQVVRTTVEPLGGKHPGSHYDAYEYLANHHSYKRDEHPTVKITYNLSPLQVGTGVHGEQQKKTVP